MKNRDTILLPISALFLASILSSGIPAAILFIVGLCLSEAYLAMDNHSICINSAKQ